ncbi:Lecithin:cholesterol acyltransferase family protein [Trichomonas vaginalis G3]|uniref:Lecithin:cholesterol acyltransferase family protein n=1 Tax=Trichomonas vaginalis (strain ATCC PRA-98 / G3) TaxID=412133 RepID=A2FF12_TRIV3|nr:O-acyltransferase protein [Trichomonas vaginalis G3]EAX96516.1 Lecithin:cholesterol acyltransferase family protein [Trichomonas vaginalis G3]KAI5506493.1 O-acyltransferase protein [Trichomonas vaginalis G3]|eukprot:XP_001309446.1 Lecithin:cholesterol acyltransferase family protein [Trichomonas vaginalis G3]
MIWLFLSTSVSLRPIILVPGTMGSNLVATITNRKTHWYCPKNLNNEEIWVDEEYVIPPIVNCLGDWLTMRYDPTINDAVDQENCKIDIVDFGGVNGMSFIDDIFNSSKLIPYMHEYIKYLQKHGYTVGQDLFGAPFDWRRGLVLGQDHYDKMTKLVEEAYVKNDNQKVVLVGHSLGGYFVHYFLTNKTTADWRAKYIESALLVAPSFGGAGTVVEQLWNGKVSFLRSLGLNKDIMAKLASSIGALYVHLPNINAFQDEVVLIDDAGKSYTAKDAFEALKANGKFRDTPEIAALHTEFYQNQLKPLDVPTFLVYNDRFDTTSGWDAQKGEKLRTDGDSVVNSFGAKYVCNNWKTNKKLLCHNLNSTSYWSTHILMVAKEEYIDLVLQHALDTSWEN